MAFAAAVILQFAPIPDQWRWRLTALAAVVLAVSAIGWLMAHMEWTRRLRANPSSTRPMVLAILFVAGGLVFVAAWLLAPKFPEKSDPDLQLRDPVLIIEPEQGFIESRKDAGHRFDLTIHNSGTCDLEWVEVYEYYYNVVNFKPLRFENADPRISDRPDTKTGPIKSGERAAFTIDISRAWPHLGERPMLSQPDAKISYAVVKLKLRYRRKLDGATFTKGEFMTISMAADVLTRGSAREMPTLPMPSLSEVASALGGTEQKQENHESAALPRTPQSSEPELVLLAPKDQQRFRWIPSQNVAVQQGPAPPDKLGTPIFRLKNLSNAVMTNIRIQWKILDGTPIRTVFLTSEYFKRYSATIDPSVSFAPYHLSNPKYISTGKKGAPVGGGWGSPALDDETMIVPYVQPTGGAAEDSADVAMPPAVAYSYAFRLVANTARPDPRSILRVEGPPLEVSMTYRQGGIDYARTFHVQSLIVPLADGGYESGLGGALEPQFWSSDNLRAIVTFSVVPVN